VFENQQPQNHVGRRARPAARLALLATLAQSRLHDLYQRVVLHDLVRMTHPWLPQIGYLFADQSVTEALLPAPMGSHADLWRADFALARLHRFFISSRLSAASSRPISQYRAQAA
jgi:hypothetical protein